jgi:hypothetical protein
LKGIPDFNLGMGAINVFEHLSFMAKRVAIVIDREAGRNVDAGNHSRLVEFKRCQFNLWLGLGTESQTTCVGIN